MTPGDACFRMRISVQSKVYWEPVEFVELREATWKGLRTATVRNEAGREFGCLMIHLTKEVQQ